MRQPLLPLLPLFIALGLGGCASTYQSQVVTAPGAKLDRTQPVLIATPKMGSFEHKDYPESGRQTAEALHVAFARFSNRVVVSAPCADLACLQAEPAGRSGYLVVPEILHWEDRNTEWSGLPDRIEIKVLVTDARSGREVAAIVLTGKSKWATFGGDHPQDLLPEPVKQYVDSLY